MSVVTGHKAAPYNKAILAAVGMFFTMLAKSFGDGHMSFVEAIQLVGAVAVSGLTVFLIPNGKRAQAVDT